jgi:hypothetical protein
MFMSLSTRTYGTLHAANAGFNVTAVGDLAGVSRLYEFTQRVFNRESVTYSRGTRSEEFS